MNRDRITYYKGCAIMLSGTSTTRLRSNGGLRKFEVYVGLYDIAGKVTKPYGRRPFVTSIREAKEYINARLLEASHPEDAALARRYAGPPESRNPR